MDKKQMSKHTHAQLECTGWRLQRESSTNLQGTAPLYLGDELLHPRTFRIQLIFIKHHHHHWSSDVHNCQLSVTKLFCHLPLPMHRMNYNTISHLHSLGEFSTVVLRLIFSVDFSRASVKWLVMSLSDTLVATGTYLLLTWISSLASFSNPRVVCLLALRPNGTIIFRCSRQRRSCARLTAHTHISHIIQPQYTYIHIYSGCGESSHHNIWQFSRQ